MPKFKFDVKTRTFDIIPAAPPNPSPVVDKHSLDRPLAIVLLTQDPTATEWVCLSVPKLYHFQAFCPEAVAQIYLSLSIGCDKYRETVFHRLDHRQALELAMAGRDRLLLVFGDDLPRWDDMRSVTLSNDLATAMGDAVICSRDQCARVIANLNAGDMVSKEAFS